MCTSYVYNYWVPGTDGCNIWKRLILPCHEHQLCSCHWESMETQVIFKSVQKNGPVYVNSYCFSVERFHVWIFTICQISNNNQIYEHYLLMSVVNWLQVMWCCLWWLNCESRFPQTSHHLNYHQRTVNIHEWPSPYNVKKMGLFMQRSLFRIPVLSQTSHITKSVLWV